MIPYLRWVITDYPCTDEPTDERTDKLMETARRLLATTCFVHEPSVEAVHALAHEGGNLPEALKSLETRRSAEHTFSTATGKKRKQLEAIRQCSSILLAYLNPTNMYDAIKKRKRKRT
tara:strand:+ start:104 stop:457 length:354 start_codon:yes stop_codon:yes gene_type:complete